MSEGRENKNQKIVTSLAHFLPLDGAPSTETIANMMDESGYTFISCPLFKHVNYPRLFFVVVANIK